LQKSYYATNHTNYDTNTDVYTLERENCKKLKNFSKKLIL